MANLGHSGIQPYLNWDPDLTGAGGRLVVSLECILYQKYLGSVLKSVGIIQ